MAKYIDADQLKAEIGRLEKHYLDREEYDCGWNNALNAMSKLLDSLPEQPVEGLEDEIKKYIEEYGYERGVDKLLITIVARHFAEWGAEHLKK